MPGSAKEILTEEVVITKTFKGRINNFTNIVKSGQRCALRFSVNDNNDKWALAFKESVVDGCIDLIFAGKEITFKNVTIEMSILDANNVKTKTVKRTNNNVISTLCEKFEAYLDYEMLSDNAEMLVPNGVLSVTAKISAQSKQSSPELKSKDLKMDLTDAYADMRFTDCTILCGDERFSCHAFMLAARDEMLSFIYTDSTENLHNYANELLKAADQYQLDHLKEVCERNLISRLTVNTALDYLVLADLYNSPDLKSAALDFVVKNAKSMISMPEWKRNAAENPEIFVEVTEALVKSSD